MAISFDARRRVFPVSIIATLSARPVALPPTTPPLTVALRPRSSRSFHVIPVSSRGGDWSLIFSSPRVVVVYWLSDVVVMPLATELAMNRRGAVVVLSDRRALRRRRRAPREPCSRGQLPSGPPCSWPPSRPPNLIPAISIRSCHPLLSYVIARRRRRVRRPKSTLPPGGAGGLGPPVHHDRAATAVFGRVSRRRSAHALETGRGTEGRVPPGPRSARCGLLAQGRTWPRWILTMVSSSNPAVASSRVGALVSRVSSATTIGAAKPT